MISRGVRVAAGVALVLSALYGCFDWNGVADARARSDGAGSPWLIENGNYRLPGPTEKTAHIGPRISAAARSRGDYHVLAYHYQAHVYEAPAGDPRRMGIVRRGTQLRAVAKVGTVGCKSGWYRLTTGGVVCSDEGFIVSRTPKRFWIRQPPADLDKPLFYRYGRVITQGALRFVRMPTAREEEILAELLAERTEQPTVLPDVVQTQMFGDYFVAVDRIESAGARRFYRTIRGRYVREEDVELRAAPKMHGELLRRGHTLPLAFVHGERPTKLARKRRDRYREVGTAEVHGRFPLLHELTHRGRTYAVGPNAIAVPREHVRVARRIARPRGVSRSEKWIHVNLTEQTLVAYEGDEPVFATLVSSGKEETGHATPTGLYRIRDKHASVTMSGRDPVEGFYEVSEVPWTQYYDGSYALHGAYWHDTFGQTRSHGCTNIAPSDARWLFYWTSPELPEGFHARQRAKGTAVYLSQEPVEARADG